MTGKPQANLRRPLLRWQVITAGVGAILLIGFLLQSGSAYTTVLVAANGGTYVEGVVGGVRYINPVLAQFYQVDADIASLVFRGLTRPDECGNVLPELATHWEISQDGTEYTFHLRDDALWHDGVPVVADDVVFTIQVVQSPDYQGPPDTALPWRDVRVEAVDRKTVRFVLPEPFAPFLSYTSLGIMPMHILGQTPIASLSEAEFNRMPIGFGPFAVVESDSEHVLLKANRDYYGELPYLDAVEFRFYRDLGEALRAYRRGDVQGIAGVTAEYMPEVAAEQTLEVYSAPLAKLSMITLNLKSATAPFLGERSFRQALMYGMNRQALISKVLEGRALIAHAPYAPCSWALNPNGFGYAFDPQEARALLSGAGWKDSDGDGVLERDGSKASFVLLASEDRTQGALAREIARQWRRIGVDAKVESVPFGQLVQDYLEAHTYDAALVQILLEGDPDPYVLWHSSQIEAGGQNYSAFVNQQADSLLEQARVEWNMDRRREIYWRFQEVFARELPALPLYYPVYTYAVDERVHGIQLGRMAVAADRFRGIANWYVNYRKQRVYEGLEIGGQ